MLWLKTRVRFEGCLLVACNVSNAACIGLFNTVGEFLALLQAPLVYGRIALLLM